MIFAPEAFALRETSFHRIEAAVAPWPAAEEPPRRHRSSFKEAISGDGLLGVFRTARVEATGGGEKGADPALVSRDQSDYAAADHPRPPPCLRAARRRASSTKWKNSAASPSSLSVCFKETNSAPGGSRRSGFNRWNSFSRRLKRLRRTAVPAWCGVVTPKRSASPGKKKP